MRIVLDDIVKKANESPQEKEWVSKYKTRIKVFLKHNKVDEKTVRYLWNEGTLRRPLVKNQTLPEDLIHDIIMLTLDNKKRYISSSVYKETLINQKIEDKEIDIIWNVGLSEGQYDDVVTMAKTKTEQLVSIIGFNDIIDTIVRPGHLQLDYILSICVALLHHNNSYINYIVQKFLDLKDLGWIYKSVSTFAKVAYFDDQLVDRIYQFTDEMSFYQILQVLMSRGNCSPISQAKYLLNK